MELLEVLLDTDIMIDVMREYAPAVEWIQALRERNAKLSLTGLTVMELVQGCENKEQVGNLREEVKPFHILWPSYLACSQALEAYMQYRLSHGLSILYALIGQMAQDLGIPLHTFNKRHFETIFKLQTVQPYKREYQ